MQKRNNIDRKITNIKNKYHTHQKKMDIGKNKRLTTNHRTNKLRKPQVTNNT